MKNPLLNFSDLPYFSQITAEDVIPALQTVLNESRQLIAELAHIEPPTWGEFALRMEDIDERISRVWSPVGHLNGVKDSPELRDAYQQGIAMLTKYHSEVGQNEDLYRQYKKLANSSSFERLSAAQQKIIQNNLRDFRLSGADLSSSDKSRFRQISQRLSDLGNQFERNVLDATQAWQITLTDPQQLSGLPQSNLDMAKQLAQDNAQAGWLFNLQIPSYLAVMQHADNAELREQMYYAYSTRASECEPNANEFDNAPITKEMLQLRLEKAQLLEYPNYAELSLVPKMANSTQQVVEFLKQLTVYAKPVAEQELKELKAFAKQHDNKDSLSPWDISYYSEKLRQQQYDFTDEQVKPYFAVPQVFAGLFEIVAKLFNVRVASNTSMETWHDDVQCFDVFDAQDERIGQFYSDLYVRKNKRGGAWMDTCIHRRHRHSKIQKPVAFLSCNFSPPIGDTPALLTHDEVETLFHEFGHTLHHLLSKVDEMGVSGINGVAWDAVELPSQFLENWCWQAESLALFAKHYQSGEAMPTSLLQKMRAARNFQAGLQTVRQIEFALFDIELHSSFDPNDENDSVQQLLDQIRQQVAVIIPPKTNRFQNSFSHIFVGGYAAGYYSYKWAEVLSADAFGRFEEEGLFNPKTGQAFLQSILQRGGVDDPNELFIEFRKRPPIIEPLLRQSGILESSQQPN